MSVLALDIGGTFIKSALVNEDGNISDFEQNDTPRGKSPKEFSEYVAYIAEQRIRKITGRAEAVGVGFPGIIDKATGKVLRAPNIPNWYPFNIGEVISDWLSLPVFMENDANAATFAEKRWGVAQGYRYVVGLTLGTGVGGGIVIDGEIYHGATGAAGELGHIVVDTEGPRCRCGKHGCLEAFVGSYGIVRDGVEIVKREKGSILWAMTNGRITAITPELVGEAATSDDRAAQKIIGRVAYYLAAGVSSIADILNPEIVVLMGGISRWGELLMKPLMKELKRRKSVTPLPDVVLSRFQEKAGVLGAGAVALAAKSDFVKR